MSPGVTSEVAETGISKIEGANTAVGVSTQDAEGYMVLLMCLTFVSLMRGALLVRQALGPSSRPQL